MQCYALSHRLMKDFPDDTIEVIDITTQEMYENYKSSVWKTIIGVEKKKNLILIAKRLVKILLSSKPKFDYKKVLYNAFEQDLPLLPLSTDRKIIKEYTEGLEFISGKYDIVIVGSDGVWEFLTYDFPNVFFLNSKMSAVKISYAASADRMHISLIQECQKKYLEEAYKDFKYLGVRDVSTENLLKEIVPYKDTHHNCDPTFLLKMDEFNHKKEIVRKKLEDAGIDTNKKIIGVMSSNEVVQAIRKKFGTKYQIVSVYNYCASADANLIDLTPTEWSIIFSFFSVTFTRFFHGTILSLKNLTPTITIDDWRKEDENHLSKLEDLYNRLGLKKHYYTKKEFFTPSMQNKILDQAEFFINNPDKEEIDNAIKKEANSYSDFYNELSKILA